MKLLISRLNSTIDKTALKSRDFSLLLIRLILAYGFLGPAMMKWQNIQATGDWFQSLGYPFPHLNAYLAGITEAVGVILLILGLGIRYISLALIFVMFIAITTVHLSNGFAAGSNGFEIPLYYAVMLFTLFAFGSGKYSLNTFLKNK